MTMMTRRLNGQSYAKIAYGQYGTFRPGTSLAEREGVKTAMTGQPRLSAHPKSGASPAPAGDALEFAAATLKLEKLRADTAGDLSIINRDMHKAKRQIKAAALRGDDHSLEFWQGEKRELQRARWRLVERLSLAEEKHRDWEISRANKGFSPKRGYLAGGDIVADASRGGRTTRGRAEGEKIRQDKGERARM